LENFFLCLDLGTLKLFPPPPPGGVVIAATLLLLLLIWALIAADVRETERLAAFGGCLAGVKEPKAVADCDDDGEWTTEEAKEGAGLIDDDEDNDEDDEDEGVRLGGGWRVE